MDSTVKKKKSVDLIDFERLLPRLLYAWPLYVISIIICLLIAQTSSNT